MRSAEDPALPNSIAWWLALLALVAPWWVGVADILGWLLAIMGLR